MTGNVACKSGFYKLKKKYMIVGKKEQSLFYG